MRTIEIDFEVYKELVALRDSEEVTYNDVLRKLLKLPKKAPQDSQGNGRSWIADGVELPHGTELRRFYKI